ncbi:2-hydroxyacid dehydrogenase [Reinekea blandensis]|uniref:2-hydroxyacid dehydrogenase n=1 Tax=Reinekea blandensis MED297 TaxID=314283 RepID=A4BED0_9GAMM|nr:glyoxylate/hydroxypyruvate reductase A [Reinekea blandensis]EAR09608.1 2-hydroxyacid dehydrogenase [Reinekea blandensis MED297]
MKHIPVIGQIPSAEVQQWIQALTDRVPEYQFCAPDELPEYEKASVRFAVVANPSPQQLAEFPSLEWVQSVWAGVEKLVDTFAGSAIEVTRLIDPRLSATMAESALLWCLYLHRDMHLYAAQQQSAIWQAHPYRPTEHCTVGILGLGELGSACAKRLSEQGFQIFGWSRTAKPDSEFRHTFGPAGLSDVLAESDILLNLLPLTSATRDLLTLAEWRQCQSGMKVINFGRGPTVNESDLITALESGLLSYAVLDVFKQEPLPAEHPFWRHEKIQVLPHISAPTSIDSAAEITARNLRKKDAGAAVPIVNFEQGY